MMTTRFVVEAIEGGFFVHCTSKQTRHKEVFDTLIGAISDAAEYAEEVGGEVLVKENCVGRLQSIMSDAADVCSL